MDPALTQNLSQLGIAVSMLVAAVVYFYRRDIRNEARNEKREAEIQARCDEERVDLTNRIRQLEDRQHHSSVETLAKVSEILSFNTRALERFCERHGSGTYPTKEGA